MSEKMHVPVLAVHTSALRITRKSDAPAFSEKRTALGYDYDYALVHADGTESPMPDKCSRITIVFDAEKGVSATIEIADI